MDLVGGLRLLARLWQADNCGSRGRGDETFKLFPAEPEFDETYRRERLSFHLDQPTNWIQFARDAKGQDRALLHSVPGGTLQVWETDKAGE